MFVVTVLPNSFTENFTLVEDDAKARLHVLVQMQINLIA